MYLKKNDLVTIKLKNIKSSDGDILPEFSSYFTTEMSPMYTSPNRVSQDVGAYLDGIGENIIYQLILKYSYEAQMIASCDYVNDEKWYYYASSWVAAKVASDALFNSKIYLGESRGKVYKKLGDFSISKDGSQDAGGPVKRMIDKLACEIFKLDIAIRFCQAPLMSCEGFTGKDFWPRTPAQSVIKNGSDPNRPLFGRQFLLDGQNPRMTGFVRRARRKYETNRNL